MLCPECGNFAANKAVRKLEESGQVGRVETTLTKIFETEIADWLDPLDPSVLSLLKVGTVCVAKFEGKTYECVVQEKSSGVYIGNEKLNGSIVDTGEPFYVEFASDITAVLFQTGYKGSLEVYIETETIHPIDPKYLPDTVATKADIFGAMEASY